MERKDDGRIPVKPVFQSGNRRAIRPARLRADDLLLASSHVCSHDIASLRFTQEKLLIHRVNDDMKAVTKTDHPPVVIQDPKRLSVAARAIPGAIILHSSTHIVERFSVISVYLIKLPDREVIHIIPGLSPVRGNTYSSILSLPHPVGILGVYPERVKIHMCFPRDTPEVLPSIDGKRQSGRDCVDLVLIHRINSYIGVVKASRDDLDIPGDIPERFSSVIGSIKRSFRGFCYDIDHVGIAFRDFYSESAHKLRKASCHLFPGLPPVYRPENTAIFVSAGERPGFPLEKP
ncbi:hypothetical protein ES703_86976 [subsurface metagenome]